MSEKSHFCYMLYSKSYDKTYFGYSGDPIKRLREHNGEINGGALKTIIGRPWKVECIIKGFKDKHEALSFEWRLNHPSLKKFKNKRLNVASQLLKTTSDSWEKGEIQILWLNNLTIEKYPKPIL